MTINQIKSIGIPTDKWTGLENTATSIACVSDAKIFIAPTTTQFYFDSTDELMFVRKTKGVLYKNGTLTKNFLYLTVEDKKYQIELVEGGVKDDTVGTYHDVMDLGNVSMINIKE